MVGLLVLGLVVGKEKGDIVQSGREWVTANGVDCMPSILTRSTKGIHDARSILSSLFSAQPEHRAYQYTKLHSEIRT